MGAHDEVITFHAKDKADAKAQARGILQDARDQQGNDAYAGHIGTCDGVRLYVSKAMSAAAAEEVAFGAESNDWRGLAEKWGPAVLIQLDDGRWYLAGMCAS